MCFGFVAGFRVGGFVGIAEADAEGELIVGREVEALEDRCAGWVVVDETDGAAEVDGADAEGLGREHDVLG